MAVWKARSQWTLRGKRLQVTQIPTEGQSLHAAVWSNVDKETLCDMVEHLNSKTETIRVLFAELNQLKAENSELRYARGGVVEFRRDRANVIGVSAEDTMAKRFEGRTPPSSPFPHINQVPGTMVTVTVDAAGNDSGEIAAKVRSFVDRQTNSLDRAECLNRIDSNTFNRDSCDTSTSTDSTSTSSTPNE